MTAPTLLTSLESAGFTLRPAPDGRLLISPAGELTAGQRAAVAEHRDELLALLRERAGVEEQDRYVLRMCWAGAWRLPPARKWGW